MVLGPGHVGDLVPHVLQEHVSVTTVTGGADLVKSLTQAVKLGPAGATKVRVEYSLKSEHEDLV